MQPDATTIRNLLKKTSHFDKDERFMATSDLIAELDKIEGQLDSSLQTPIRDAILKELDDASNDVQAIACRCLSAIVKKFNVEQVEEIVDKLGALLIEGKMELRDIYSIALKNIVSSVPDDFGQQISKKLVRRLLQGLKKNKKILETEEEKQEEQRNELNRLIACLDILKDLLTRFGFTIADEHQNILNTVQPMLNDENGDIRKKVSITLGAVVGVVNDEQFRALMNNVIQQIKSMKNDDKLFNYIRTIGIFSRNAGKRISEYLNQIVPLLITICSDKKLDEDPTETNKELRENCLQALETLIVQCPKQMSEYSKDLMNVALKLMSFDPNYSYDENEEQDDNKMEVDDFDDGGWNDEEDDNNNDGWDANAGGDVGAQDDDTSWKVRRAAIKMLAALIQTHKSHVQQFHIEICDALLNRFKEHDVNVKIEIFDTFRILLIASVVAEHGTLGSMNNPFELPPMVRQVSSMELMSEKLDKMIQCAVVEFKSKSSNAKVKLSLLSIVNDLILVRSAERSNKVPLLTDEGLKSYFPQLIPQLISCCQDNDVQVQTKALHVVYLILQRHRSQEALLILNDVQDVIIKCTLSDYSRVKTRALLTISRAIECIRPMDNEDIKYDRKYDSIVNKFFDVSFKQLQLKDVEQEVKKAALDAVAKCIAHFGDLLSKHIDSTLDVLLQRLNNEVTRQTALHAFSTIASSSLRVDLNKCVDKLVSDISSFLKQHSASLKVDTANALQAVIKSSGKNVKSQLIEHLVEQCGDFVNDNDLNLCHSILDLLSQVLIVQPSSASVNAKAVFPKCYKFLQSPLIQGYALQSLKDYFVTFDKITRGKVVSFENLKNELIKSAESNLSRQSYSAISQCLAALTLEADSKIQHKAIEELLSLIESQLDNQSQIALLCIGEMGKTLDLSSHNNIEGKIFSAFNRESEAVKWAASYALGNMAVGNMKLYVPILLTMIKENPERQYLLLNSLKEIITVHSNNEQRMEILKPYGVSIIPLLMANANSNDDGVRSMVAECLGKFAVIDTTIFEEIEKLLKDERFAIRATMAAAIKFSLSKSNQFIIPDTTISKFLALLSDKNLIVKRQAFLTINTILHVNYRLIQYELTNILPIIYNGTITNKDLIREVDLGPFTHKVDDGLPLRKAAFQCMDTLLESASHSLELLEFLKFLTNGIKDDSPDINMLTYQILARLGQNYGNQIVDGLDDLADPLMDSIKGKMNDAKGNKDSERAKDILRAAVKACYILNIIPNVANARKFVGFYSRVEKTKILVPMIAEISKSSQNPQQQQQQQRQTQE